MAPADRGSDAEPDTVTGPFAATPTPPYTAVIFSSVRSDVGADEYAETSRRMESLACEQPGYLGIESARSGLGITVSYWRDAGSALAWKQVTEHLLAQRHGRDQWYRAYRVRVATVEREYGHPGVVGGSWHAAAMTADLDAVQTRTAASNAVEDLGWRYLLDNLTSSVTVTSLADAVTVAEVATGACGADADQHLRIDLRADRVELQLQTRAVTGVTGHDLRLARAVSTALAAGGHATSGAISDGDHRSVQSLEIAIDAIDIPAIRPFWKAVLAYSDEPGRGGGPEDALLDPTGQLPSIWFQQMDAPRPQRNRIHLDITVSHDEAEGRIRAALAAGGRLLDESYARAFWVLADAEGNEICVCTWQDRDGKRE